MISSKIFSRVAGFGMALSMAAALAAPAAAASTACTTLTNDYNAELTAYNSIKALVQASATHSQQLSSLRSSISSSISSAKSLYGQDVTNTENVSRLSSNAAFLDKSIATVQQQSLISSHYMVPLDALTTASTSVTQGINAELAWESAQQNLYITFMNKIHTTAEQLSVQIQQQHC